MLARVREYLLNLLLLQLLRWLLLLLLRHA